MKQRSGQGVVGVVVVAVAGAALAGLLVASCRPAVYADPVAFYLLEVANRATDRARVQVDMGGHYFLDVRMDPGAPLPSVVTVTLESGGSRIFRMQTARGTVDSQKDGYLAAGFREVHFYNGESGPYRSYEYKSVGCDGTGWPCWDDDTLLYHRRPNETKDYLFVESPDRPFYLEWDETNLDLGRIVITFLPSTEDESEKGVEPVAARR